MRIACMPIPYTHMKIILIAYAMNRMICVANVREEKGRVVLGKAPYKAR